MNTDNDGPKAQYPPPDFSQTFSAMKLVSEADGLEGTVICPRCGGPIRYQKSPPDGRPFQRGRCDTDNCLAWIT